MALPNSYWNHLGLKTLTARPGSVSIRRLDEPPDAGPHVRWCGRGRGNPAPYPIPGVSADPAGLTARARPKARPDSRAANLSNLDFYKGFIWMVAT